MSALRRWLTFLRLAWGRPQATVVGAVERQRARQRDAARAAFLQSQSLSQRAAGAPFGDVQ